MLDCLTRIQTKTSLSKFALLTLSLLVIALHPMSRVPRQTGINTEHSTQAITLEEHDPQNGPSRFSRSCVNGKTRKMKAIVCNGTGGATGVDSNKDGEMVSFRSWRRRTVSYWQISTPRPSVSRLVTNRSCGITQISFPNGASASTTSKVHND